MVAVAYTPPGARLTEVSVKRELTVYRDLTGAYQMDLIMTGKIWGFCHISRGRSEGYRLRQVVAHGRFDCIAF